jgi:hypothetical protein
VLNAWTQLQATNDRDLHRVLRPAAQPSCEELPAVVLHRALVVTALLPYRTATTRPVACGRMAALERNFDRLLVAELGPS